MCSKDITLEDLGYDKIQDNDDFIMYFENKEKIVRIQIVFAKEQKAVELIPKINNRDHYFTRVNMDLLKAIYNKCKELEWLDKEVK